MFNVPSFMGFDFVSSPAFEFTINTNNTSVGSTTNTQIYPDGPDTLTIVVTNLSATTPANVFGRLSWTEAQA